MIKRDTDVEVVSKATTNQRIGRTNVQETCTAVDERDKQCISENNEPDLVLNPLSE